MVGTMISRRELLATVTASLTLGTFGAGCGDGPEVAPPPDAAPGPALCDVDFLHGVASGDPLRDRVILWTRVTPRGAAACAVSVAWEISPSLDFAETVDRGVFVTSEDRDYTVKVDVGGLLPGATYYYRFSVGNARSPVGRTRTAPDDTLDLLRLAVVSCASLAHGYFHIYRDLAERLDLAAVIHLGDYIYEYASGHYGDVRPYDPPTETVTLADYRRRHAQYKRDADVRAVHQQHPFIAVWDDHEFSNNAWVGGAPGHMPRTEGPWSARRAAAMRAYFEWMPIREQPDGRIWRRFSFGNLVDLVMLDTRMWARPEQESGRTPEVYDPHRALLGEQQERWLYNALATSTARWKVIGNQVRMAPMFLKFNTDSWDGYPAARERFLGALGQARADNVAVLTGDIHTSWAMDLALDPFDPDAYDPRTGAGSLAVEFIVPGVTSPGHPREVESMVPDFLRANPHMRYANATQRGYILLDCTDERLQAEWFHLPYGSVEQRERQRATFSAAWMMRSMRNHLTPGGNPSSPSPDPPAAAPWEPA